MPGILICEIVFCIAVEHDREPGSNLIIETNRLHPEGFGLALGEFAPVSPQAESASINIWRSARRYSTNPVIPSDVALWIEQALQMGWMPKQNGLPFCVVVVEDALKRGEL